MKELAVVILAAGKGKRMNNPDLAKVMAKLSEKPLIGHVLDTVIELEPKITVLVVGHQKESVIQYVDELHFPSLFFAEQTEQLGTGHAVAQAKPYLNNFDGDILILAGDVPLIKPETLLEFAEQHNKADADVSVLSAFAAEPFGYGRIIRDSNGSFIKITEEKDAGEEEKKIKEINSGIYLVKAKILFPALDQISNKNAQGEYYLTDIIDVLSRQGSKIQAISNSTFEELQGVNSPDDLIKAEASFKLMRKVQKADD